MSDFKRRCEMLDQLGVKYYLDKEWRGEVGKDRRTYEVEVIKHITPPFSAQDWVELCSDEGNYYLGGCCGTLSAVQDLLNHLFRFEHKYMDTKRFEELENSLIAHGDENWWVHSSNVEDVFAEAKSNWNRLEPLEKLSYIWAIIKGFHKQELISISVQQNTDKLQLALKTISYIADNLSWHYLLSDNHKNDGKNNANQLLAKAKMLPALKKVYETLVNDDTTFNGYALVKLENDDDAVSDRRGIHIYNSIEDVWNLLQEQEQYYAKYENHAERKSMFEQFGARPVSVNLKDGMIFTGEVIRFNND